MYIYTICNIYIYIYKSNKAHTYICKYTSYLFFSYERMRYAYELHNIINHKPSVTIS